MDQEDLNSIMVFPWECRSTTSKEMLPQCPKCGERYFGDGKVFLCTECEHIAQHAQQQRLFE